MLGSEAGRHEATDPEQWVDLHGDAIYRYARPRVRASDIAEELVQETLLAAFQARDRFSGRSAERTWLIGILRNKIVDHYRRRGREVPASELTGDIDIMNELFDERGRWRNPPSAWDPEPGSLLEREDFLRVLGTCLDGLPERQAHVFALRILEEIPGEEVRKLLDLTPTNLGVLLHRARLKLRRCLEVTWFERDPEAGSEKD